MRSRSSDRNDTAASARVSDDEQAIAEDSRKNSHPVTRTFHSPSAGELIGQFYIRLRLSGGHQVPSEATGL